MEVFIMRVSAGQGEDRRTWIVERAIVLQILRDDHDERWLRAELAQEISDHPPDIVGRALARLERAGVLRLDGDYAEASRAARRLDELEMISI
jgi:hypothetical protein